MADRRSVGRLMVSISVPYFLGAGTEIPSARRPPRQPRPGDGEDAKATSHPAAEDAQGAPEGHVSGGIISVTSVTGWFPGADPKPWPRDTAHPSSWPSSTGANWCLVQAFLQE